MRIRAARPDDVEGLLGIEREAFATDRLTRRKLRHLMTRGNAALLVADDAGEVAGYALLLFRRGLRSARLYGVAVRAGRRRAGLGRKLLAAAERLAAGRGCRSLRLEVAQDNKAAVKVYERNGYDRTSALEDYYEDHRPAWRYVKAL